MTADRPPLPSGQPGAAWGLVALGLLAFDALLLLVLAVAAGVLTWEEGLRAQPVSRWSGVAALIPVVLAAQALQLRRFWKSRRLTGESWSAFAARSGGEVVEDGLQVRVVTRRPPWSLTLSRHTGQGDFPTTYTRVSAPYRPAGELHFHVMPERMRGLAKFTADYLATHPLVRLLARRAAGESRSSLDSGFDDPELDRHFVLSATDPIAARALMADAAVRPLLLALPDVFLTNLPDERPAEAPACVSASVEEEITDPGTLALLHDLVQAVLDALQRRGLAEPPAPP